MKLKPEDAAKMLALQKELAVVLKRANDQKLEAAIAAFALVRLARELFDKYPPPVRRALTAVCGLFLERKAVVVEDDPASKLLVM
jgi:hypothetical protein